MDGSVLTDLVSVSLVQVVVVVSSLVETGYLCSWSNLDAPSPECVRMEGSVWVCV